MVVKEGYIVENEFRKTSEYEKDIAARYGFLKHTGYEIHELEDDIVLDQYNSFLNIWHNSSWVTYLLPNDYRLITVSGFGSSKLFLDGKISTGFYSDSFLIKDDMIVDSIDINEDFGINLETYE
jgi:hypothetical protein